MLRELQLQRVKCAEGTMEMRDGNSVGCEGIKRK